MILFVEKQNGVLSKCLDQAYKQATFRIRVEASWIKKGKSTLFIKRNADKQSILTCFQRMYRPQKRDKCADSPGKLVRTSKPAYWTLSRQGTQALRNQLARL